MNNKTGGPAFPTGTAFQGMTLRDYFAAKAMQPMVNEYDDFDLMAAEAYKIADSMLEVRNNELR